MQYLDTNYRTVVTTQWQLKDAIDRLGREGFTIIKSEKITQGKVCLTTKRIVDEFKSQK